MPKLWVVVTCMGRLEFLRQTAPPVLGCPDVGYCLVDYSCPDRAGQWLTCTFEEEARAGRLLVEEIPGRSLFNKCEALNAGARRATQAGAEYLCFLDADTLVEPGFFEWAAGRLNPQRFLIAALENGKDVASLTGVLVVSAPAFAASRGFDQAFRGWGGEDLEFRLRLHLLQRLGYEDIPLSWLRPITHDDSLRSRFYEEKDVRSSNGRNFQLLEGKMARWRRLRWYDPVVAERLFYR